MRKDRVDLSNMSVSEAERHLGYLLRQALSSTPLGSFVLRTPDGRLLFLDARPLLAKLDAEKLAEFLLTLGLSEDQVVEILAHLEE